MRLQQCTIQGIKGLHARHLCCCETSGPHDCAPPVAVVPSDRKMDHVDGIRLASTHSSARDHVAYRFSRVLTPGVKCASAQQRCGRGWAG